MSSSNSVFIREMQWTFPEDVWPWLIKALRHDALVWEYLISEPCQKTLDMTALRPEDLSPANLALLAMNYPISAGSLRTEPMQPVDIEKNFVDGSSGPRLALANAGWEALCLRERYRLLGSWDGLYTDFSSLSTTAIACLFGMLADPQELFRIVLNSSPGQEALDQAVSLSAHALLSNPQTPAEHYGFASQLLDRIPKATGLKFIKILGRYSPALSAELARDMSAQFQTSPAPLDSSSEPAILEHISALAASADARILADQKDQAVSIIEDSIQAARLLEARLIAQKAEIHSAQGDHQAALEAWEEASRLAPSSTDLLAQMAMALMDAGQLTEVQEIIDAAQAPNSLLQIASARLAFQCDKEDEARFEALRALKSLEIEAADYLPVIPGRALPAAQLAGILLQLNQPGPAAKAALVASRQSPNDASIQALLARAQFACGDLEGAIRSSQVAVCMMPSRLDFQRDLTERLELVGDWKSALEERKKLFEKLETPSVEDLHSLAECAINAGDAALCLSVCQEILEQAPEDGAALAWKGEALAASGDNESALENLQRAVQTAPSLAIPWLSLAKYYHNAGQPHKALETLRAATYAAPNDALIHLKLGEAFIEDGSPTQALSDLRLAADLAAKAQSSFQSETIWYRQAHLKMVIALLLGQTLARLGHQAEAHMVLEEAYHQAPSNSEIARGYAQILISEGDLQAALLPLETVLNDRPPDLAPYLDFAECVLELHQHSEQDISLEKAVLALHRALELQPDHPQAIAMLGEAMLGCKKPTEARAAFSRALLSDLGQDPLWQVRLSLGLGEAMLELGETETAIAALQEANRIDPLNPRIQRCLSQAYLKAGLADEALQSARAALLLAPTDIEMLIWFADQVMKLQERSGYVVQEAHQEALSALKRAGQISPTRPNLLVKLGQVQMKFGEPTLAHQTFLQLIADQGEYGLAPGSAKDYHAGANCLLQLGDPSSAVTCLERAIKLDGKSETSMLTLLSDLAIAHRQAGDPVEALEIINRAITTFPNQAVLFLMKADLLTDLNLHSPGVSESNRETISSDVLNCLHTAIKLKPDDPELHERVANIYRVAGDLRQASAHSKRMLDICGESLPQRQRARALAADLAIVQLQPEVARGLLELDLPAFESTSEAAAFDAPEYYILRAECALDSGEDYTAAHEVQSVAAIAPNHAAVISLNARIAYRRNEPRSAGELLTSGLLTVGNLSKATPLVIRSLATAALEIGHWEQAIQLHECLVENFPLEPLSHLALGRTLVLCAEHQRLCEPLEVVKRTPGHGLLTELNANKCDASLRQTEELVNRARGSLPGSVQAQVNLWRARGRSAFKPDTTSAALLADLPPSPENIAAQIAVLRQTGELTLAGFLARDYSKNPVVLLQLALALIDEKPRQAMAAAQAAADVLTDSQNRSGSQLNADLSPLIQVLLARLHHRNGNRSGNHAAAIQAIRNALSAWDDEPRWHFLAAEIFLGRGLHDDLIDREEAISHLEQAIRLDPKYALPSIRLGQIYLQEGMPESTILVCEQAARLAPDEPEIWGLLAQAYRSQGDLEQAATLSEHAIALAPNNTGYLVLRGEIALEAGDGQAAHAQSLAALENDPNNLDAVLLTARALRALEQPDEALNVLEKAIQFVAQPLQLHLERIRILFQTKGTDIAYQSIQDLNQRYPDEPQVLALLAEILTSAGEPDVAIRVAQRALRINGETEVLSAQEQANLHFILGKLLRQGGQLDQSIHHLSEAARHTSRSVDIYLELGQANRERRQYSEAMEAYQEAAKSAPKDYRPYNEMGLTLRDSKDYLGAERMLRKAAEMAPNDPAVHRSLAAVVALNLLHNRRDPIHSYQV